MAHFLNSPQGNNISFSPKESFDWSGIGMLAEQARKNMQIQEDRQTLRKIMGVPEPAPETGLRGVMNRLGGLFGAGQENQPVGDLAKAVLEAKLKQAGQEWKPQTEEAALRFEKAKKGLDITSPEGLTSEQQLQARALSKKIYGVRGAQFGLPAIYEEMKKGKNIDEIEDSLRYSTQSKEFTGAIRNATQSILMNTSEDKSQKAMDYIDDLFSKGDTEGAKNQLKRLARTQAGAEESRSIVGKERTIKLLDEIQGDLDKLEQSGINTNIFSGTAEQVAAKIGTVREPELRKVATKISAAVQNYRRSMTGVQFGMPENKEYQLMFPKIDRTANFNTSNINGLKEVMQGDLDNFYSLSMGDNEYKTIFGQPTKTNINNVQAQSQDKFKVGQTITKNGKTYKYEGNGQWSY